MILQTTEGVVPVTTVEMMLPHEHLFTDLRGPDHPDYGKADPEDVVRVMAPLMQKVKESGVSVLVECTPVGVGRNVPIVTRLARKSGLRVLVPTGVYGRAKFVPGAYSTLSEKELEDWMVKELTEGIEDTGINAGFIKLGCDKTPLTDFQKRLLRASARVSLKTGAAVAIHTPHGAHAIEQADILENAGMSLHRFIWVHAHKESDMQIHKQLATRGVYVEYDSLGTKKSNDERLIEIIREMTESGYADRILLSHDAGWYRPGEPDGGAQREYTYMTTVFIPKMKAAGMKEEVIKLITEENPKRAFAMPQSR